MLSGFKEGESDKSSLLTIGFIVGELSFSNSFYLGLIVALKLSRFTSWCSSSRSRSTSCSTEEHLEMFFASLSIALGKEFFGGFLSSLKRLEFLIVFDVRVLLAGSFSS